MLVAVLSVAVEPVGAQQATAAATPVLHQQRLVLQPPPADIGAVPVFGRPPDQPGQAAGCAPAWPCRLRLFGVIEKSGGIGLKAPILTW